MMRIARIPAFVWLAAFILHGHAFQAHAAERPASGDRPRPADVVRAPRNHAPGAPQSAAAAREDLSACQSRKIIGTGAGFCMIN
jgi:hypothetical protein